MRTFLMFAAALAIFPAVAHAADATSDRSKLNGTWTVTALSFEDTEIPATQLKTVPWEWDIGEKKIISKRPGGGGNIHEEELEINLDPAKTPKSIDITDVSRKETTKGIYELDGDTLKISIVTDPKLDRPADFTTKKDSKCVVMTLKRTGK